MTLFNPTGNFLDNIAELEAQLGHTSAATKYKLTRLTHPDGKHLFLPARPGKFVSAALMQFLSDGRQSFVIDGEKHELMKRFFGPLWKDSGHGTIDFLREPGVVVEEVITEYDFEGEVNELWEKRAVLTPWSLTDTGVLDDVVKLLDYGVYRIAEPDSSTENGWRVNDWLKKAALLYMQLSQNELIEGGELTRWYDKVPLKFTTWSKEDFSQAGIRAVPGSVTRYGAFIGPKVVLMPGSFVNIGGYVDEGCMVDTGARVGSCAQVGKKVHISGGAGIGGVFEPIQANPTIIEDDAFIGACSEVVEGVIVRKGAVLSMGVFIGKNTPIVDRTQDSAILYGEVPENAVVMMGIHPKKGLVCPQIVKYRDSKTDAATVLNEILRG